MHVDNFTYLSGVRDDFTWDECPERQAICSPPHGNHETFPLNDFMARCLDKGTVLHLTFNSVTVYTRNISHDSSLGIVNGLWAG
jgi:hypothetical protein